MLGFIDNLHDSTARNEFNKLDIKDIYSVNVWLDKHKNVVENIEGENIICMDFETSNKYCDFRDFNLREFILEYEEEIRKDIQHGLNLITEIYDEYDNVAYKGILEVIENDIYVKDQYNSLIKILDTDNLRINYIETARIVSKKPTLITVKEFISQLDNIQLFRNTRITLYLYNYNKPIFIRNTSKNKEYGESINFNRICDIEKYENYHISRFTVEMI